MPGPALAAVHPPLNRLGLGVTSGLRPLAYEAARTGLWLDFAQAEYWVANRRFRTAELVPGFTYTRTGTAFDLAGTTSFSANTPRRTGAGLLVEAGATNLSPRSAEFDDAFWTKLASTVSANASTAPDGTLTADAVVEDNTAGRHFVYNGSVATVVSTVYTFSVFARAGTGRSVIAVGLRSTDGLVGYASTFDLSSGALGTAQTTGVPTSTARAISNAGNGWYRCSVTFAAPTTSTFEEIGISDSVSPTWFAGMPSYTGNSTGSILIWGAQLETGSTASSYIPTTTTSASRGADAASVTGLTFSGAHSVIALVGTNAGTVSGAAYQLDDTTTNNRSAVYNSSGNVNVFVASGGVGQADQISGAWSNSGRRVAARVQTNDVRAAVNGILGTADTVATLPVGTLSRLGVGGPGTGNTAIDGWVQLLAILPRALSDSELQNGTA